MLRRYARVEIGVYRQVSLSVMDRMGRQMGWSALKRGVIAFGINAVYVKERFFGWRHFTRLQMPEKLNAMGPM